MQIVAGTSGVGNQVLGPNLTRFPPMAFTTDLSHPLCPFLGASNLPLAALNPRLPRGFLEVLSLDSASPLVSYPTSLDWKSATLVL